MYSEQPVRRARGEAGCDPRPAYRPKGSRNAQRATPFKVLIYARRPLASGMAHSQAPHVNLTSAAGLGSLRSGRAGCPQPALQETRVASTVEQEACAGDEFCGF